MKTNNNTLFVFFTLSVAYLTFIACNPFAVSLSNASYSGSGLSAESVDIAKENATNLIRNTNDSAREIGGLSAESVDIAEEQ
ncbi:MAG TPA: hypothetical protein VE130_07970 [Nitrososphaeraceae archaeon]|nr:hypothetical protein [Nitrososphaeraceae archaeon]